MNFKLLLPNVQEFIAENRNKNLSALVLKGSPFPGISSKELAQNIFGKKIAEKKLPTWFASENVFYPEKLNLEQTSSEITAAYKASLLQGTKLADLTGGFGIDTYYFSRRFKKVLYTEINEELAALAAHNFQILGAHNIQIFKGNGLTALEIGENWDALYADPSRRNTAGAKVFRLARCLPNIPDNLDFLFEKTKIILLKTSPLLDISLGIAELKEKVAEIHIISVKNEVKELLWLLKKDQRGSVLLKTRNFLKKEVQVFDGVFESPLKFANFAAPKKYIYEPNPALMKSGLFADLAEATGTQKLHPNTHLFTSDSLKKFPGRIFQITETMDYKPKIINKRFKQEKANISTRNFPVSVANIRKKFGIQEGGNSYLFFTTGASNNKIVLLCKKVSAREKL